MNTQTISLCMIVKNEEEVIAKCLESVKGFVDEIIVVDTGSTDSTKDIAKNFGAKVYDYKWEDDFAAARNYAKSFATSDWILQLDADEYFPKDEIVKLKTELSRVNGDAASIQITNLIANNVVGNTHSYARVFKNKPTFTYQYRIHEQILNNGEYIPSESINITIIHTGYTKEVIKKKNKKERNMKILKKELKKNPNDSFMNFNLANEYLAMEKNNEALELLKKAHKYSGGSGVSFAIVSTIIKVLIKLKRNEDALFVIKDAKEIYPNYTDIFYYEGVILEEMGRDEEAKEAFKKCLEIGEADKKYLTLKGVGTVFPLERLLGFYTKERNYEKIVETLNSLLAMEKTKLPYIYQMVLLLRKSMKEDEIINYLDKIYHDENEKDLKTKFEIASTFRMKKGIIKYFQKMKDISFETGSIEDNFYLNLFINNDERIKEKTILNNGKEKETIKLAIIYYLNTKEEIVKEKLEKNKTAKMILEVLDETLNIEELRKNNFDVSLYVSVLEELILLEKYDVVEKLLQVEDKFDPSVYKKIGELFLKYYTDDLAMEYFINYLKYDENNHKVLSLVSELLYQLEMYEDAILFAQKSFGLNQSNFKPIEVMIESCKKAGEMKSAREIAQNSLALFPESKYLLQQIKFQL